MLSRAGQCTKHKAELIKGQRDLRFQGVSTKSRTKYGEWLSYYLITMLFYFHGNFCKVANSSWDW